MLPLSLRYEIIGAFALSLCNFKDVGVDGLGRYESRGQLPLGNGLRTNFISLGPLDCLKVLSFRWVVSSIAIDVLCGAIAEGRSHLGSLGLFRRVLSSSFIHRLDCKPGSPLIV